MLKNRLLENSVLACLIVAVCIGNTSYNGESLKKLHEQEQYKAEKEYKEKKTKDLQSKDRDYLSSFIQTLNNTTIASETMSNQSFINNTALDNSAIMNSGVAKNQLVEAYNVQKQKNNDTVGWIKISGTQVDYPIMYSSDNNYYLKRTPDKASSVYGSIFLDQQSNGQWGVFNLIHGHNMNNGSMFADIAKMMNPDYFNEHKTIQIYDGNTLKEYTAFCAFSLDDRKEGIPIQYSSIEDYYAKLDHYMTRSRVEGTYPKDCTDFVILNTCWYGDSGGEKNSHAIIIGYRSK